MFTWEVALVLVILIVLGAGIVRLATQRQMEILKFYLIPKDTPVKQTILRHGKDQAVNSNTEQQKNRPEQETQEQPPTPP